MKPTFRKERASALRFLEQGDMDVLGLLPHSTNYTFLARVRTTEEEALVVYKPRRGETPLWDFPDGTLCRREVAAYEVAEVLGWPAIPPTILRDGPEGSGSVQLFVDHDPEEHYFTMRAQRMDDFRRVAAFDVVINNADRKGGHCLLAEDGRIYLVDHGVSFSVEPKLRTVIWDFAGEALPDDICADVARLAAELRAGSPRDRLEELLTPREIEAAVRRAERLVEAGRFPAPGPGRPYPWPPV
jgi:uncharacterized repeat protein (TIGR03843 family)